MGGMFTPRPSPIATLVAATDVAALAEIAKAVGVDGAQQRLRSSTYGAGGWSGQLAPSGVSGGLRCAELRLWRAEMRGAPPAAG